MTDSQEEQARLGMTGEQHVDEYGNSDQWGRGGVYTAAGEYDLAATEELLAERFAPIDERLPETVGPFDRRPSQRPYRASYYREGPFEGSHGNTSTDLYVSIYPQGPCLHRWTVGIQERQEKYATSPRNGWGTWTHPDARRCESPGPAVATALAVMRGEVPIHRRRSE